MVFFFFFQAEDGIRDLYVTGVQTCALPILTPASVPESGRHVALKRTANVSTGGTAIDVTDEVHPDNRAILERAATAMELSVVGIDFLIEDIGRSWREAGGVVLEANALPGL